MNKQTVFDVAGYIRLSREDGDKPESDSITNQKKLIVDYLKDRADCALYDLYVDDGFTGTNFRRPAFERMTEDIEKGAVNCVIVKDLSRFGRDYIDTGKYLERYFPDHDVRFISITDNIDSSRQVYDMLLPIKNIFNEQYARDISSKVHASMRMKQRAGEFIGAFASYGYRKSPEDKNKLVVDEYAAEVVRRIFSMYVSGYGKNSIATALNQEGIVCPSEYKKHNGENYRNGHRLETTSYWTYSTINRLLQNEFYLGNMVQGRKVQHMRGRQRTTQKEDWIIVENTHDPVIDRETWDKAQELLRRRTRTPELHKSAGIFAGFLKCGDCKRAMVKKSGTGGREDRYCCGTYVRSGRQFCTSHSVLGKQLEAVILKDLNIIFESRSDIRQLVEKSRSVSVTVQEPAQRIKVLERELDRLERMKKRAYGDYQEELLTREEYADYRKNCIWKENLLQRQLERLKEERKSGKESDYSCSPWISHLLEHGNAVSLDRETIMEMVSEIEVQEGGIIRIIYNFTGELKPVFPADSG